MTSPPEPPVRHRALHPVETMGDLTIGLSVIAAATLVERSSTAIGIALTVAVLSYTVWHDFAQVANRVALRARTVRWPLVLVAILGLVMTWATPQVLAATGVVYAAAYWIARIALARAIWARPEFGWGINPYTMSAFFSGPLLAVGCLADGDARLAIWVSAALHDVAVPFILRSRTANLPDDPEHFADRYLLGVGAMVLGGGAVLLGSAAGAGAGSAAWTWWAGVVAAAVLVGSVWWAYLAVLRPAQVCPPPDPALSRHLVSYAHLALASGAVLALGALGLALAEPLAVAGWWVSGLLGCGLLLAYGGIAGVSSWLLGRPQWVPWGGVAWSLVVGIAGSYVPGLVLLGLAAGAAAVVAWYAAPQLPVPRTSERDETHRAVRV